MTETRGTYTTTKGGVRRQSRVPYADPHYEKPTPGDIRAALQEGNLTGSMAGRLLGVDGRTIRKWTGGERDIPYSAWRLLLIEVGADLKDNSG